MFRVPAPFMFRLPPMLVPAASVTVPPVVVTFPVKPPNAPAPLMSTVAAPLSRILANPVTAALLKVNDPLVVLLNRL